MKNPNPKQLLSAVKGSFIANTEADKATAALYEDLQNLSDSVIQTDLHFSIKGWNEPAEKIYGLPGALGKNIFELVTISFIKGSVEQLKKEMAERGYWEGELIFHRHDGLHIYFRTTVNYVKDGDEKPSSIIIVNHNITRERLAEKKLAEAEDTYQTLVNTLVDGVLMLDASGKITTCNKRAAEILDVPMERMLGVMPVSHDWKVFKLDGRNFPDSELPAIVTLQTGFPQKNVRMQLQKPSGISLWISVSSQALIRENEFNPYAVVVSLSDISDLVKKEEELQKSNERFSYSSKVTSDAIWDINLETNEIYRSETFYPLSGYSPGEIGPEMDWWFSKVHPDDRDRVKKKIDAHIRKGLERWEDEYRFKCADGSYKILYDTGLILYKNKKPARLIGAIRDLTEQKKREQQLLDEQEQRYKMTSPVTTKGKEKDSTGKKLFADINETVKRAQSHIESAQAGSGDSLHKAIEYLIQVQELIRNSGK
ncbi:MAG: PAS domain-containing protein [Bacteroidota bacterium]|nr:PAS domain-containing protein [Bacteroidota bacterium]